jgi:hypothetical protein
MYNIVRKVQSLLICHIMDQLIFISSVLKIIALQFTSRCEWW